MPRRVRADRRCLLLSIVSFSLRSLHNRSFQARHVCNGPTSCAMLVISHAEFFRFTRENWPGPEMFIPLARCASIPHFHYAIGLILNKDWSTLRRRLGSWEQTPNSGVQGSKGWAMRLPSRMKSSHPAPLPFPGIKAAPNNPLSRILFLFCRPADRRWNRRKARFLRARPTRLK